MLEKIKDRDQSRKVIDEYTTAANESTVFMSPLFEIEVLLLISQSLDNYLEHRITADKTIEGILKDIQNNTDRIANAAEKNE